jgi:hypothetical protein
MLPWRCCQAKAEAEAAAARAAAAERARLAAEAKAEAALKARREEVAQLVADEQASRAAREALQKVCAPDAAAASRARHTAQKKSLKTDLKKASAYAKKLKELVANQVASLQKDAESLNLFMYVSEVVAALHSPELLARLKQADCPAVAHLCAAFHVR